MVLLAVGAGRAQQRTADWANDESLYVRHPICLLNTINSK